MGFLISENQQQGTYSVCNCGGRGPKFKVALCQLSLTFGTSDTQGDRAKYRQSN